MKFKHYFSLGEAFGYFFRKKDPNRKTNFTTKAMHGINKISMVIFLIGLLVIVGRIIFR